MKVFLSHSSADKDLARRLAYDLQEANVDVWLDEWEVRVGEEFAQKIEQGLAEVQFVIVLLTRSSVASEWVNREWRRKVEEEADTSRVAVIPVRGERCEIPDFLAQRSHADISGGSYPLGLAHLLTMLGHYSDDASITMPEAPAPAVSASPDMVPVVAPLGLEVGADLIPLFEADNEGFSRALSDLAPRMRAALQERFGFQFPGVRISGNDIDMPPRSACIFIEDVPELMVEVGADDVLVDGDVEQLAALGLGAEPRSDPAAGRVRARIAAADRAAADAHGFETWDACEYLFLALQSVLERMASLFLGVDETRRLVDAIAPSSGDLVAKTVPAIVSWWELTDVLQRLVAEDISVADIKSILEGLSTQPPGVHDPAMLAEAARHALNGQITAKYARAGAVPVMLLDKEVEDLVARAIQRVPAGMYLSLEPEVSWKIEAALGETLDSLGTPAHGIPILVTSAEVRPFVRGIVRLKFHRVPVVSRSDLSADVPVEVLARIDIRQTASKPTSPAGGTTP